MAVSTINVNRVYPPIVSSSIPAFLATDNSLNISFSLPKSLNYGDVKNISIKFSQQSNNKSVVNTDIYYDGIIYMTKPITSTNGIYTVSVKSSDIKLGDNQGWVPNTFYKIQIRFGYSELTYTDKVSFFKWKKAQNTATAFSEWSNVIITKAIQEPVVDILNNKDTTSLDVGFIITDSQNVETTRFPKFHGGYYNVAEEPMDKYRFRLYEGSYSSKSIPTEDPYLTSGWLQFNGSGNNQYSGLVEYSFNQQLIHTGNKVYSLVFDVITANGYEKSSDFYVFTITETYLKQLESLAFIVKDNSGSSIFESTLYNADQVSFALYEKLFDIEGEEPTFIQGYYNDTDVEDNGKLIHFTAGDIAYRIGTIGYDAQLKKLSRETRLNAIKDFYTDLRADENASLEIYIKNIPYFVAEIAETADGKKYTKQVRKYQSLDGTFILSRACEKDNYTQWVDIAQFDWYNESGYDKKLTLLYEDFTIESGVKYKYALQKKNVAGLRSAPKYEGDDVDTSPAHYSNFQYSYIYNNGIQIRLNYDCKINSYKHTTLFQKQDSLNSKYPIILRNGLAHYAEFQLGAKISLLSDEDLSFLMRNDNAGGYFHSWTGDLVISKDKYFDYASRNNLSRYNDTEISQKMVQGYSKFNTDITDDNIYMERIYRHWVEEFLNDGGYKLFKSATEGNHIITLTNVSWTPQATLSRMIYDFSSTAYEVADCTPENIKLYNINPLTTISNNSRLAIENANTKNIKTVGQIARTFNGKYDKEVVNGKLNIFENSKFDTTYDNIYQAIRLKEEITISEEKKYVLKRVRAIWVEQYPKLMLKNYIEYLKHRENGTLIEQLENSIELLRREQLLKEYEENQTNIISMIINGKEISMMPGRIYHIDDIVLEDMYLKFTRPILINYIVDLEEQDYLDRVTVAKREFAQLGQIAGVFTENKDILNNYQFFRNNDSVIVNEDYNYSLYSTLDILKVIKEKTHNMILNSYTDMKLQSSYDKLMVQIDTYLEKIKSGIYDINDLIIEGTKLLEAYRPLASLKADEQTDAWMNNSDQMVIYNFSGVESLEIEADANTELIVYRTETYDPTIDTSLINSKGRSMRIGPSNKLVLNPIEGNTIISSIKFERPTYAIINYKAISSLEVKGYIEGQE